MDKKEFFEPEVKFVELDAVQMLDSSNDTPIIIAPGMGEGEEEE